MQNPKKSLGALLSESADKFGTRTAVVSGKSSVTYSQLEADANRIASALISAGIPPKSRIGIYLDKSIESVAAIFGVLKAGCAYVPLDVSSPGERNSLIIGDCSLTAVFTSEKRFARLSEFSSRHPSVKILFVFGTVKEQSIATAQVKDSAFLNQQAGTPPDIKINEKDLAYILYTSGSTGTPKGVMISHQGALAFIDWAKDFFQVGEHDVLSSHAPFYFDLSIFDIYVSVTAGAKLCLVPSGISYFPASVIDFIKENGITIWYSVPSILVQMALSGELQNNALNSLRKILYAGEVFPYPQLNALKKALPNVEITNLYGPTETNVITFYQLWHAGDLIKNVPIGEACPYCKIVVVDENLRPVPCGTEGELLVSSETLMAGYWGSASQTAKSIRTLNLDGQERAYYLTGDIVSQTEDGNFHFKCRKDLQIKSRGFRIEIGEIEAVLCKNADLLEAAMVIPVADPERGFRLNAFVVKKRNSTSNAEGLKRFCSEHLPLYMVPEKFEFCESLPKTPTGKIDRRAIEKTVQS